MWPVMTLTLLLQLTDDEQLYAQQEVQEPQQIEVAQPKETEQCEGAAAWPAEEDQQG